MIAAVDEHNKGGHYDKKGTIIMGVMLVVRLGVEK